MEGLLPLDLLIQPNMQLHSYFTGLEGSLFLSSDFFFFLRGDISDTQKSAESYNRHLLPTRFNKYQWHFRLQEVKYYRQELKSPFSSSLLPQK